MGLAPEILVPQLGEYLHAKGLISRDNLREALEQQQADRQDHREPHLLGHILMDRGVIDRETLDRAITEQLLELRNALLHANENLELQVEERTAELARTLEKLEHLNKLQTRFVAHISHELRTPLYHLTGYLELLAGEDLGPINREQREALFTMQRASERLGILIEDLILFTATTERPLHLRFEPTEVLPICESTLTHFKDMAGKGQIALHLDCPDDLPSVQANPDKLTWVVRHLVDNAIKFTKPGGTVTLTAKSKSGSVFFMVRDTGIGIAGECCEEIFEPFRQLDDSVSRRYGGMGLGLALARKIIRAHGSDLLVESEPEKGSVFSFHLPVSPTKA